MTHGSWSVDWGTKCMCFSMRLDDTWGGKEGSALKNGRTKKTARVDDATVGEVSLDVWGHTLHKGCNLDLRKVNRVCLFPSVAFLKVTKNEQESESSIHEKKIMTVARYFSIYSIVSWHFAILPIGIWVCAIPAHGFATPCLQLYDGKAKGWSSGALHDVSKGTWFINLKKATTFQSKSCPIQLWVGRKYGVNRLQDQQHPSKANSFWIL